MYSKSPFKFIQIKFMPVLSIILIALLSWSQPGFASNSFIQLSTCCPHEHELVVYQLTNPMMTDEEIKEVQLALKKLGYFRGKTSGSYDLKTTEAVKNFQKVSGIAVDGVLGKSTWQALSQQFKNSVDHTATLRNPRGNISIEIDIDRRKLSVFENNKKFREYFVAVGLARTPTPVGQWKIIRKAKNWGTGFGTRWLGLNVPWGLYGIHGTNKSWSIGTDASGGCIRMFNEDVEELYNWVKVDTLVKVVGTVYSPFYEERWKVHKGHKGTVVMMVQRGLQKEGYLKSSPDGVFGESTELALKKLQKERGFEVTGQVDVNIWPVLGL